MSKYGELLKAFENFEVNESLFDLPSKLEVVNNDDLSKVESSMKELGALYNVKSITLEGSVLSVVGKGDSKTATADVVQYLTKKGVMTKPLLSNTTNADVKKNKVDANTTNDIDVNRKASGEMNFDNSKDADSLTIGAQKDNP